MGKFETFTTSIDIKILLSDLILQINENNFDITKEILHQGFISYENDIYNDEYSDIIWSNRLPKNTWNLKNF